jgi:hypothetical protein
MASFSFGWQMLKWTRLWESWERRDGKERRQSLGLSSIVLETLFHVEDFIGCTPTSNAYYLCAKLQLTGQIDSKSQGRIAILSSLRFVETKSAKNPFNFTNRLRQQSMVALFLSSLLASTTYVKAGCLLVMKQSNIDLRWLRSKMHC